LCCLPPRHAAALEVTAGDYEALPPGTSLALLYYQHAERNSLVTGGRQVSSNFRLDSDIALARYIHVLKLSDDAVLDPQVIVPFGRLRTGGDAAVLGSAGGGADIIVGAPVKFVLDQATRDVASIGPYLYLPTGAYDREKMLNLGEHRWKALLQLAYIRHFSTAWALDVVGDATIHGDNGSYTRAGATLGQKPRYEAQAHLRYQLSPATALSAGIGNVRGGETDVDGVRQGDQLDTRYGRLTVTRFVTPTTQLQLQWGRDFSVSNGPKEKNRINFRIARLL
jgi:hypothetical protein